MKTNKVITTLAMMAALGGSSLTTVSAFADTTPDADTNALTTDSSTDSSTTTDSSTKASTTDSSTATTDATTDTSPAADVKETPAADVKTPATPATPATRTPVPFSVAAGQGWLSPPMPSPRARPPVGRFRLLLPPARLALPVPWQSRQLARPEGWSPGSARPRWATAALPPVPSESVPPAQAALPTF